MISGVIAIWDIRSRKFKLINIELNFSRRLSELLISLFTVPCKTTKQITKFCSKTLKYSLTFRSQNIFHFTALTRPCEQNIGTLCMQELFFVGWVDYLKHCKWSTFLQKERRVLTRKRTKMSNYLTHRYFVVDYVCCANKCNQK